MSSRALRQALMWLPGVSRMRWTNSRAAIAEATEGNSDAFAAHTAARLRALTVSERWLRVREDLYAWAAHQPFCCL